MPYIDGFNMSDREAGTREQGPKERERSVKRDWVARGSNDNNLLIVWEGMPRMG